MHEALSTGLPVLAVIIAALVNRYDIKDVRAEIKELRSEMGRRFDVVDAELRYFHDTTGKLTGRVDELSKRVQ